MDLPGGGSYGTVTTITEKLSIIIYQPWAAKKKFLSVSSYFPFYCVKSGGVESLPHYGEWWLCNTLPWRWSRFKGLRKRERELPRRREMSYFSLPTLTLCAQRTLENLREQVQPLLGSEKKYLQLLLSWFTLILERWDVTVMGLCLIETLEEPFEGVGRWKKQGVNW